MRNMSSPLADAHQGGDLRPGIAVRKLPDTASSSALFRDSESPEQPRLHQLVFAGNTDEAGETMAGVIRAVKPPTQLR